MARLLPLFYLLFLTELVWSQNRGLDSLKELIRHSKSDTTKVNTQISICKILWVSGQLDTAIIYAEDAKKLSKAINFKKGLAHAYNNLGIINMYKGNYLRAEELYLEANRIFREISFMKKVADTYNNLGETNRYSGNYPKALKYHYSAMKIREEIKDSNGIAMSCNNIAIIQEKQSNYKESLKNYLICLKIYEKKGGKEDIARTYNNISEIFRLQKLFKKALEYQEISLSKRKEINDVPGIAMSHNNIGSIQYGMALEAKKVGNLKEAETLVTKAGKNFILSNELTKKTGDNYSLAMTTMNIGSLYTFNKRYKDAEKYFNEGLSIAKKINNKECIKHAYHTLSEMYREMGNYKEAYIKYNLQIIYRDSLLNEENTKKTIESQMQYEFDKKDAVGKAEQKQKDVLNEKEKQVQRAILIGVIIGLMMMLVFSVFIYNRFQVTKIQKKIIEVKEHEASKQNEIISFQKQIVEAKHKEIRDSINYAERIQKALLASKKLLTENLNDYFIFFEPKDVVSGDFYWAAKLHNNNFVLVTADSTGHGVPGAIMSMLNIACLDKAVTEGITEPDLLLNETRKLIIENLKNDGSEEGGKDGMDGSLICYDFKNNKLCYAAANNPIWIVRNNELIELKSDKMPVGKHDKDQTPFTRHEIQLQKDDVVYSLTDGMPDQFGGAKGKKFMYKQLKELLLSIVSFPMEEQKATLKNSLNIWKGELEQVDDICIIGIRI